MPKQTPHSEHINAAAGIMKNHPTLTAAMAMQLAGFSEEDCSNPSLHVLVRRRLPGRGKRAYKKTLPTLSASLPPAVRGPIADVVVGDGKGGEESVGSPLTDPTFDPPGTCSTQEDASDIDDEAKTGRTCGNVEGEGYLQGSTQGCDDFVRPREK